MLFIGTACFYGFKLVLIPEYSISLKEHSQIVLYGVILIYL